MQTVAFHITSTGIQVASLSKKKKGDSHFLKITLKGNVKPLDILHPSFTGTDFLTVTALDPKKVILRSLALKLRSKKEVLAALPFQTEGILPYKEEEEVVLSPMIERKGDASFHVLLQAATQTEVEGHIEKMKEIGIDADIISSASSALFRFARWAFPTRPNLIHLHIEPEGGLAIEITEARLSAAQTIPFGTQEITSNWGATESEVERLIAFLQKKAPTHSELLLTGFMPLHSPLHLLLEKRFQLLSAAEGEYAIAMGLALDASAKDGKSCLLRPKETPSTRMREKKKVATLAFTAVCLGFCLTFSMLGGLSLQRKEAKLLESLGYGQKREGSRIEKELLYSLSRAGKEKLPVASAPSLSELLSFLSSHPALKGDATIGKVRYERVQPGSLEKGGSTGVVKVECEFETADPEIARNFLSALKSETGRIDQRKGIEWSADYGLYRATFFLLPAGGPTR